MELFRIEEGNHYASGLNFKPFWSLTRISFSTILYENCMYDLGNLNNMDINKIYGVTFGLDQDNNSFRIGWNCYKQNGLLQYHYYAHNQGVRNPAPNDPYDKALLFEAPSSEQHRFDIILNRKDNEIAVMSDLDTELAKTKRVPFNFSGVPTWGRYNFPYFGGDEVAQHNMDIIII